MTAPDRDYAVRLGAILRRQDPVALRDFLVEQAARFGDERQVTDVRGIDGVDLEALLHRMIVARPDLGDLHPESERWLAAHGLAAPVTPRSQHRAPRRPRPTKPGRDGRGRPRAPECML